ncbi:helix-turn-helix domain-containing protein [Arthrobacter russicus]
MSPLDHSPEALRWALKMTGLSQKEFALKCGISPSHVSEILGGTRNAKPALLRSMSRALNCPIVVLQAKLSAEQNQLTPAAKGQIEKTSDVGALRLRA